MTTRILIIHTSAQLEEASGLVDLLEAWLSLPQDAIVCSSVPGYTMRSRAGVGMGGPEFAALLDELGAAVALVDEPALRDAQLWFDAAAVWSRDKRLAVVVDCAERAAQLPSQLAVAPVAVRSDRSAIVAMIEDLAFDLGLEPRLGKEARRALDQWSSLPPPPSSVETSAFPPPAHGGIEPEAAQSYEAIDTVPPPPFAPGEALESDSQDYEQDDEPYELDESDVEPMPFDVAQPRHSRVEARLTCTISLAAGCAIGECSFHREEGSNFVSELDTPFGMFIDAAGGNWEELKRLGDVEVWLAATDNLLQALPPEHRDAHEWYEIGFQFATLRSIAEQGLPDELEQRAVHQEIWNQSMAQLRTSMANAGVAPRDIRRLQAMLENLIGPDAKRDYGNIGRSLVELREHAGAGDRGELQLPGRAVG